LFSIARYRFSCALFLAFTIFGSVVHAEWNWTFPFYSADTEAAKQSRPGTQPTAPAKSETTPSPEKDGTAQTPGAECVIIPPSASTPGPDSKPAESAQPAVQKLQPPPRALSNFKPEQKFGNMILDEDTQWNGLIQIEGMVTVSPQTTLTVMPGSVIRFAANSGILVYGRIAIKGAPESQVYISSMYDEPFPSDWSGIFLIGTEKNNIFDNCVIHGADTAIQASFSAFEANGVRISNSETALKLVNSAVTLRNSAISSTVNGIQAVKSEVDLEAMAIEQNRSALSLQSSSLTTVNVRLRHNTQTALTADKSQLKLDRMLFSSNLNGLKATDCDGSIVNSRFLSNGETAAIFTRSTIRFSDNHVSGSRVGLQLDDGNSTIWKNSIAGNSSYNLLYLGEERYFAGGNWLGQSLPEKMEISVFSKNPGALLIAPLLAVDPHPPARLDSAKVTD
jgi:hypothetical protein